MAILYVNDDGSNTAPYDTLAKAATTLAVAAAAGAAGDDFYMGMDHAETLSATTVYTFPGTAAAPNRLISIDTTTEVYNKADNVQLDLSGGTHDLDIRGHVKFYGFSVKIGDDLIINVSPVRYLWNDCVIELSSASAKIRWGNANGQNVVRLKKTDINFSGGGTQASIQGATGIWDMRDGSVTKGSGGSPIALVNGSDRTLFYSFAGVDLSDWAFPLVDVADAADLLVEFHHSVLHASAALTTGTIASAGTRILMSGCDDGTGNKLYRFEYVDYYGSIVHDDGIYLDRLRSADTAKISWKMVTTGNAKEFSEPLVSPPIVKRVRATGSKTFKVHLVWDSASDLNDDDVWLEIEYLEAAADTDSAFADDGMADILATPAAQTTSTKTWIGTGGFTNENKQSLDVAVTVNRVGPVIARVHLAKPSTTIYIDPVLVEEDA